MEAVNANGRRTPFVIDPVAERQWWSSTFVPPGPGHPRPTVAIGTESGVAVFDLETGQRTRIFAGHSAPVVSLAPSPDGRWLASGSQDQTVMLYPLDGCDTRPALGAVFRQRPDGSWTVAEVKLASAAAAMGLKAGDVVLEVGTGKGRDELKYYRKPEEIAEFAKLVDGLEPMTYTIGIKVRRMVLDPDDRSCASGSSSCRPRSGTALLRDPSPDTDKEWVVWTPQGYYDTSIEGDTRLLGWHTNPPYRSSRPTDFVPVVTYAGTMNRPDVLDRLWRTGDLQQALAPLPADTPPPVAVAVANQPPRVMLASIGGDAKMPAPGVVWKVSVPRPKVSLRVVADDGKPPIRARRIVLDEQLKPQPPIGKPTASFSEDVDVELPPNRTVRMSVEAENVIGTRRTESIDIVYVQPPQQPPLPRLVLLSIGTDVLADPQLPPVKFADKDAADLARFLAGHLISADATKPKLTESRVLTGAEASTGSITGALDHLQILLREKQVNKGDVVAIVIAAHVLSLNDSTIMAASDSKIGQPARSIIQTRDLCDLLGRFTDYGCRVIVLLDCVHNVGEPLVSEIKPLVRELYQKRRVITFVASTEGPSDVDVPKEHGLFALGLLQVFQGANAGGPSGDRSGGFTLDQFKTALRDAVQELSGRQQDAACYIPLELPEQTWFAKP